MGSEHAAARAVEIPYAVHAEDEGNELVAYHRKEAPMSLIVETLMLQAKTAILDDQFSRYSELAREGKTEQSLEQAHTVLISVADILRGNNKLMDRISQSNAD